VKIELEQRPQRDATCAFCRDAVAESERAECGRCGVVCHPDCWQEHGRCPTIACGGTPLGLRPDVTASRERTPPGIAEPGWLAVPPLVRARQLARFGAILAVCVGAIAGFLYGGVIAPRHGFDLGGALKWALAGVPAGLAGAVYGALQGLVGVRSPQVEGLGLVTLFVGAAAFCASLIGSGSSVLAVVVTLPVVLVCGRLFGFDPGRRR